MGKNSPLVTGDDKYMLESPKSPDKQVIPRRFPRIGSQFQTRIAKSTDPLDRPLPDLMSAEYPYVTEFEVVSNGNVRFSDANSEQAALSHPCSTDASHDLPSSRGGTLIHAPIRDMNQYSSFVLPFVISLSSPPQNQITPQAWVQHMIQLHSTGVASRKRAQRGPVKRKQANEEELVWSLESMLQSEQDSRKKKKLPSQVTAIGEEEAVTLEYLGRHFPRNLPTAMLNIVAAMSGGQATKMRKCEDKKWAEHRSTAPAVNASIHWRDLYERVVFPFTSSIRGKMQTETFDQYNVDGDVPNFPSKIDSENISDDIGLETDDLKGAWRSILACGKSIERQLNGEILGDRKPLLSTLLTFVGNAYLLPLPESCFGSQHVVIEEVSNNMLFLLEHIQRAQHVQARIRDKVFNEVGEGIDSDSLLKFLDNECRALPIKLLESDLLYKSRAVIVDWENRLSSLFDTKDGDSEESALQIRLEDAEHLYDEAKTHGFLSKALVQLGSRVHKARDLRLRIKQWKNSFPQGGKGSLKTLSAFVKDMNRIKLGFAETLEIFELHRLSESWIDRANVAIRSKMSLHAIQSLIREAEKIPLDLAEYTEKLKTRVRSAEQWLDALEDVVPFKHFGESKLEWMSNLNTALHDVDQVSLHELSSEGNRIPVVVDEAKILQVAFDAKNWSMKAKRWVPGMADSKDGKLSDLRDHLGKLSTLRDRLPISDPEKAAWFPEGAKELLDIVRAADCWFEKYQEILDGSEMNSVVSKSVSLGKLKEIVRESNRIHANIGPTASKVSKVLVQAETWHNSHLDLLRRCRLITENDNQDGGFSHFVGRSELASAIEDAESTISIDMEEVVKLKNLLMKVDHWRQRVSLIAPKRSKRSGRVARSKLTLTDLTSLIAESTELPIDTTDEVNRLQIQLSTVEAWRFEVSAQLESIVGGFHKLLSRVLSVYGEAEEFGVEFYSKSPDLDSQSSKDSSAIDSGQDIDMQDSDDGEDAYDVGIFSTSAGSGAVVLRQIKDLQEGANDVCVTTSEGELGDFLEAVAAWCVRSFKYLNSPRDIFDKRHFEAFDRFIQEGKQLLQDYGTQNMESSEDDIRTRIGNACGVLVSDQVFRLTILQRERESFKEWCRAANALLSDEKNLTADNLSNLAQQSRRFPATTDLVSKVRGLSAKVEKWTGETKEILDSGRKLSVNDIQDLLDSGEKLKVNSGELMKLKEKLDSAQDWLNEVIKHTSGEGVVNVHAVNQLIHAHESLLVELPEEVAELRQAVVGYCLCRRPYEGFMIGCDHCEEWYHGPCIGVSESKAGRFERFACVRCATKEVFDSSASAVAGLIRKWTCTKDLKKARQVDYQKIQRRFRKEKKDVEKHTAVMKESEQQLSVLLEGGAVCETSDSRAEKASEIPAASEKPTEREGAPDVERLQDKLQIASLPETVKCTGAENKSFVNEHVVFPKLNTIRSQPCPAKASSTTGSHALDTHGADPSHQSFEESKIGKVAKEAEIRAKLQRAKLIVSQAKANLEIISGQSRQRKFTEARENELSNVLRRWVLHVRDHVLVPSDICKAELARPQFGLSLSQPMMDAIQYARDLNIADLPDIPSMENHFKCMSWGLTALALIRRKPTIDEVNYMIATADDLELPDERAIRTLKFMANRASQCQIRSQKALSPKPGETKSIKVSVLQDILDAAKELPVFIPETKLLQAAIEDKGTRHCICGGPNDGLEMFQCDACKKWFHADCVGTAEIFADESWLCCSCGGASATPKAVRPNNAVRTTPLEPTFTDKTLSPHAPDPEEMWPPFGLLGSSKSIEELGVSFSAIETSDSPTGSTETELSNLKNHSACACEDSVKPKPLPMMVKHEELLSSEDRETETDGIQSIHQMATDCHHRDEKSVSVSPSVQCIDISRT